MEKEYLYVGYYISTSGEFVLKVGTTNDLDRRRMEHNRSYKKSPHYPMKENTTFEYLWFKKLSKYNTLRYEDKTKADWQNNQIGEYVRNDRFILSTIPQFVSLTIRKTCNIPLAI